MTSARVAAREEAGMASVGCGQGAPVDPVGFDIAQKIGPTGPVDSQPGRRRGETSPRRLRGGRVRSNLSDILDNDRPRGPALARPYGYRRTAMSA
jgi:hypothetical protein